MYNVKIMKEIMKNRCANSGNDEIIISCSGASDVGYISDQVARKISRNNHRKMSCLALFATCDEEKFFKLKNKDVYVIDGCDEDCGRKLMEGRGIKDYSYLRITDLGFEKGKTPASHETVNAVVDHVFTFY